MASGAEGLRTEVSHRAARANLLGQGGHWWLHQPGPSGSIVSEAWAARKVGVLPKVDALPQALVP